MYKVFEVAQRGLNKLNDKAVNSVSEHLTGDNHTYHHKFVTGCVIMTCGVLLSKVGVGPIHILTEIIGFSIHAIGVIPFADIVSKTWAERNKRIRESKQDNNGNNTGESTGIS